MPNNWSDSEVEAVVADYFDMLRAELADQRYNKTAHRRALRSRLRDRSDGSVERKHQNISAVLLEMGNPFIVGYKPLSNYQRSLVEAVAAYLNAHSELHRLFKQDAQFAPSVPRVEDFLAALENPPEHHENKPQRATEPGAIYNPAGANYLEMEARNQSLGEAGEQFVINYERARLIHLEKESLADRIEQVSASVGPSAGFDIRSYEKDGSDRFIEAKTTKYGKSTPFFVTPNELRFSERHASKYFLFRLFAFRANPRLFCLRGHLHDVCRLEPSEFTATPNI